MNEPQGHWPGRSWPTSSRAGEASLSDSDVWSLLRQLRTRLSDGLDDENRDRQELAEDALETLDMVLPRPDDDQR